MTEVNVKYDVDDKKIQQMVDNNPPKKKLSERVKDRIIGIKNWIHLNVRKFMVAAALIFMIAMIIIIPNPTYHIVFIFVFCGVLFIVINYLTPMVGLVSIDFKNNTTLLMKISYHRLHDYKILDCDGKASTFVYWLCAGKDRVLIIDSIDFINDTIILNPVCSQLAFVKSFKDSLIDLREKLQCVMNENEKLKIYCEYEAFQIAGRINDMNPLVKIYRKQRPTVDKTVLDTDKIDKDNDNNIGSVQ